MTGWRELEATLDAVALEGKAIRVWWRDDDAGRDHPNLDRLLELADRRGVPLALAVVPVWLEAPAQARIAASSRTDILQHGIAHLNHAPAGAKSCELAGRELEAIERDLAEGRARLVEAFGADFVAVLVPPWNRIEPALIGRLTACGFCGLSTYGRRPELEATAGLIQVNTHLDPVDWRGDRLFVGEVAALDRLIAVLDPDEPIGLLSHHLVMDEPGWAFFDRLLGLLAGHPGATLCSAHQLFQPRNGTSA
ncbi:MAG: polysaccharide deacetylase family protein [Pseudomonadota bacterium]